MPAWEHHPRLVSVDDARRELPSRERGGFVRSWEHRICIEPKVRIFGGTPKNEVSIEAVIFTAAVWTFAHLFYRYRQGRWRMKRRNLPV